MIIEDPILLEERDASFWQIMFNRPKANILDTEMVAALTDAFLRAREERDLKAICLTGSGDHFSFGASVEEHRPDQVADMLRTFHRMFRVMADTPVVFFAAVRGQCLGGGLELAAFCHRIVAEHDAKLGQPEIRLGVFAPVASVLLRERVGQPMAEHLCLSGEVLQAEAALRIGLVDELAEDPEEAAYRYYQSHMAQHSASSLRYAATAVRHGFHERLFTDLQAVEDLYIEELQKTHDAVEGIQAFLEKRDPQWKNR